MFQPRISIVLPTFNRAWCIERAIKSVIAQTVQEWELVIIDDGSVDSTESLVGKYLHDTRVRYFKKKNGGVGPARNFGIEHSTSELITFLDSDDEFTPRAIEQMIKDSHLLDQENVGMILYLAKKIDHETYRDHRLVDGQVVGYKSAVVGEWPVVETVQLCKRDTLRKYFFPKISGGLEVMLWLSILKHEGPALIRTEVLRVYHTEHHSRLTGVAGIKSRAKNMPDLYNLFLKQFERDYEELNPKKLAYFYLEKGVFEIINGEVKRGRNSVQKAVRLNKRKVLIAICILCASVLPNNLFLVLAQFGHAFKSSIA